MLLFIRNMKLPPHGEFTTPLCIISMLPLVVYVCSNLVPSIDAKKCSALNFEDVPDGPDLFPLYPNPVTDM